MSIVRCKSTFIMSGRRTVREGEMFDAAHPVVVKHPGLFEPIEMSTFEPVESARSKPGEKRAAGRPRKTKKADDA